MQAMRFEKAVHWSNIALPQHCRILYSPQPEISPFLFQKFFNTGAYITHNPI